MSITKNGNSADSNGHSNGHTNGAMQYYQAGATGGTPYGYYYDVAQAYQPGDAAVPSSQNETGGFAQGESQDARTQGAFPSSPVYMQRFPSFQQGQEYQNFGGERQPVYGSPQNFAYAQGGVYQDPNQFMGSTLGPQSNPLGSSTNADVMGRQQNMMGGAMSAAQTMPMLAGGVYQLGMNRGAIPVVSVNDQTFAHMGPRGGGAMSWADVAKVASENQASVSGTMPQMAPVMQPKVLSPGQPFALAPTTLPPMFALNGQPRFVPGNLPVYGRGFPPPYQLLTISSQSFPARGGRGFKGFTGPRGRGFGFPARGGFDSVLNQRYESGNERGPRAQRVRFGAPGGGEEDLSLPGGREQFNREDFDVAPLAAKFFVIKSYSEDDVHKSIKYGVWASTPNGNKRLQAAFREAREAETGRVFLLFSVNASGQFCGVAEMIGDVDFDKSLDVWQQDKWNGQFKVQWHFVKDVPNGQFRHIILANNENKPVTNSRDTQEVPYDQGVEVLTIFKAFAAKTSILDDFAFYDNRQKQLQERREKTKQSRSQRRQKAATETIGDDDERNTSPTTDLTESGSEPAAEEASRPSEEESLEERLSSLAVTSRPQEETEL